MLSKRGPAPTGCVADRTVFWDEFVRTPNLRAKTYVVHEPAATNLACVELRARRLEDWFFARRWVSIRAGRRLLYWLLDEVEAHGFRFQVGTAKPPEGAPATLDEPWNRASRLWAELTEEERRVHRELFPQEAQLLESGYDWDHEAVYRSGTALARDGMGRWIEEQEGVVYEWVRVPEEWTWRRYPLYVIRQPTASSALAVPGEGTAA